MVKVECPNIDQEIRLLGRISSQKSGSFYVFGKKFQSMADRDKI